MKVFIKNLNYILDNGPTFFSKQMLWHLSKNKVIQIEKNQQEADVEYCISRETYEKVKPRVTRIVDLKDFISKDREVEARQIVKKSNALVFESEYSKKAFVKKYKVDIPCYVIPNSISKKMIDEIESVDLKEDMLEKNIWVTKIYTSDRNRSLDNINYFIEKSLEKGDDNDILLVVGKEPSSDFKDIFNNSETGEKSEAFKNIHFLGKVPWPAFISILKSSSHYIHLKFFDDCPISLLEAQYCGCNIVFADSGGTKNFVKKGILVEDSFESEEAESVFDESKKLDFKKIKNYKNDDFDIKNCFLENACNLYHEVLKNVTKNQ